MPREYNLSVYRGVLCPFATKYQRKYYMVHSQRAKSVICRLSKSRVIHGPEIIDIAGKVARKWSGNWASTVKEFDIANYAAQGHLNWYVLDRMLHSDEYEQAIKERRNVSDILAHRKSEAEKLELSKRKRYYRVCQRINRTENYLYSLRHAVKTLKEAIHEKESHNV